MWIVLCGVDRCGKSTVAEHYKQQGFEVIHMSAPDKKYTQPGYTGPSYMDETMDLISSKTGHNVVWDRSWYGEIIWSAVYGRAPQLNEEDIDILREIEAHNDTVRMILMDPDTAAHWRRCVDNHEPLTLPQFNLARRLYSQMAHKYNFSVTSMPQFMEANGKKTEPKVEPVAAQESPKEQDKVESAKTSSISKEQARLEQANAINAILKSKKIFKQVGGEFDAVESQVRKFLTGKLGELLGAGSDPDSLSREDIVIVKEFVKRLKEKQAR
jgi:hypothetical protein